ncbi:hypothetical protein [Thaumasiovibrio sp. DFM-14]|uniref:rolling circle replication-associated protein n=1 Tax=Thaumasiovibrio sp. DFM-14 TaxID=3384792 RepID=UPI0039A0AE27
MLMNDKDIAYIVAGIQPVDKTKKNIASYHAGFLGFDFVGPRPVPLSYAQYWKITTSQREINRQRAIMKKNESFRPRLHDEFKEEVRARRAARSAENNRLVQGCKSPTRPLDSRLKSKTIALRRSLKGNVEIDPRGFMSPESLYDSADRGQRTGRKSTVQLLHQTWSGKYRLQHVVELTPGDAPDSNDGERYSEALTSRAVGKIFESAAYVATCHEGFRTFVTLTCSSEQRERIFSGDTTLGKEVSRFIDGVRKMYQRGWHGINDDNQPFECEPTEKDFHYIWVAECPANEDGEPNPHVHVLMNWNVDKQHFSAWAKRIEGIWGNGFAHLERIRNPKGAGSYIIKAVGYASKGKNANQGLIRGNRYGIAKPSRAPGWECLDSFHADNMAGIIKECSYKLSQWRKPYERQLRQLSAKKEQTIKAIGIVKQQDDATHLAKLRARLKRLEQQRLEANNALKARGVYASTKNRFSLHFDGDDAGDKAYDFLLWAAGARGWKMCRVSGESCEESRTIARIHYVNHRKAWLEKRAYWQSVLNDPLNHERATDSHDEICAALCRSYLNGASLTTDKPKPAHFTFSG